MMNTSWKMVLIVSLAWTGLFTLAAGSKLVAADFPSAEISNGQLQVKLYLPDSKNGYYRGTRFDWSGEIISLKYRGHEYYGPWFNRVDPKVHDYRYDGPEIIASPYILALQIAPEVAFAPLFILWFGYNITPKILVAVLIVFLICSTST